VKSISLLGGFSHNNQLQDGEENLLDSLSAPTPGVSPGRGGIGAAGIDRCMSAST